MKIYFVLFRFTLTSLLSALIDNSIFVAVYSVTSSLALSQSLARVVATTFNYVSVRKVVFNSGQKVSSTLPKYLSLVVISGLVSFSLIKILLLFFPLSVIAAKLCAESLVFLVNFCIQRDFIFVKADPAR
jgi:putative flippase GtrA